VLLFAIIGFAAMNTSDGKSPLMMALVFVVFLYYLALVLVTILQLHIKSYLPFMLVILLLGSVVSILALMVISPTIAWIYLGLLIFLFALMCYENQKQLFPWIPKRIKNFFEFNRFRFRTICVVFFIYFHVNLFVQLRKKFNNVVCVYKMSYL